MFDKNPKYVNQINGKGEYGNNHINLNMKYLDSIISVEPIIGVIDCDLTNGKLGIKLNGFNYFLITASIKCHI